MANKRINELDTRVPVSTDLVIVGDPTTGYSYKTTLSSIVSSAATVTKVQFITAQAGFPSIGATTYTNSNFSGADVVMVWRNGLPLFEGNPNDGDTYFTFASTTVTFSEALQAAEKIIILAIKLT
jgi:hypothetical protein